MTSAFGLNPIPEIVFGPGRLAEVGDRITAMLGTQVPVLLIADPALGPAGITARAMDYLKAQYHKPRIFDEFTGEPKASTIDRATSAGIDHGTRAILAIGGGSVLDTAKLVAACAVSQTPAEAYGLCKTELPANPLPVIAIPTTAGTGSEVTSTSVFSNA